MRNFSIKDNRIKKLEDKNRELGVRCEWAESCNSELDLQLTAREKDIEKLLEEEHELSDLPDEYVRQECPNCRELEKEVIELREAKHTPIQTPDIILSSEFECIISKENYDMVRDAIDKRKSAIVVKCYGGKFVRVVADVDN